MFFLKNCDDVVCCVVLCWLNNTTTKMFEKHPSSINQWKGTDGVVPLFLPAIEKEIQEHSNIISIYRGKRKLEREKNPPPPRLFDLYTENSVPEDQFIYRK